VQKSFPDLNLELDLLLIQRLAIDLFSGTIGQRFAGTQELLGTRTGFALCPTKSAVKFLIRTNSSLGSNQFLIV
jgi:hypothetical protein